MKMIHPDPLAQIVAMNIRNLSGIVAMLASLSSVTIAVKVEISL